MANSPWTAIALGFVAVAYALARHATPTVQRAASLAGALSIMNLVLLGVVWPSIHTVLALVALPALFLVIWQVASPTRFRTGLPFAYLIAVLSLPVGAFAFQHWWL